MIAGGNKLMSATHTHNMAEQGNHFVAVGDNNDNQGQAFLGKHDATCLFS